MSHALWFRSSLVCLHCGSHIDARDTRLHTSSLGQDPIDEPVSPGEVVALDLDDLRDGYLMLHAPDAAPDIRALEQWGCRVCGQVQWAQLDFWREDPQHHRFLGAQSVLLEPEVIERMHFVSRRLELWLPDNTGPQGDRVRALVGHLLP